MLRLQSLGRSRLGAFQAWCVQGLVRSRLGEAERETIEGALRDADGHKARAAKSLGIGRTTLYRKMRALKITADERMTAPGP